MPSGAEVSAKPNSSQPIWGLTQKRPGSDLAHFVWNDFGEFKGMPNNAQASAKTRLSQPIWGLTQKSIGADLVSLWMILKKLGLGRGGQFSGVCEDHKGGGRGGEGGGGGELRED